MKIMVATTKGGLDDIVSPVFGRCATFTIVEVEDKEIKNVKVIPNQYAGGMSGVGIQVAQFAVNEGVKAVLAGTFGPNASAVLMQAGIEIIQVSGMSVKDAVTKYLNKELAASTYGAPIVPPVYGSGMGFGRGGGRGRGMGRGFRRFCPPYIPSPGMPLAPDPYAPSIQQPTKEQEIEWLKAEKEALENRLKEIKKRIEELK